jgi:hypothetical protein
MTCFRVEVVENTQKRYQENETYHTYEDSMWNTKHPAEIDLVHGKYSAGNVAPDRKRADDVVHPNLPTSWISLYEPIDSRWTYVP